MHSRFYLKSLSLTITICLFTSCLPPPKYVDLTQKAKIAIVGFSLDRSITSENSDEVDQGPGLLQKLAKGKEKAKKDYFQYHQQALDGIWAQFKGNIQDALLGIPLVSFDEIINNEHLLALTAPKEKKIMGTDFSVASTKLNPEGLNYVSAYNSTLMDSICSLLGCDLLLVADNKADFDSVPPPISSDGSGIVIKPTAKAHINLTTTLYIHEKGNGLVAIEKFTTSSDDKMLVVWTNSNPEDYPKLMMQANAKVYEKIKKEFIYHQQKSAEQIQSGTK